jgi:hypothetical protein
LRGLWGRSRTSREIRRLEIDERVDAALELLRRRQAKQLRRQSKLKARPTAEAPDIGSVIGPDT